MSSDISLMSLFKSSEKSELEIEESVSFNELNSFKNKKRLAGIEELS